MFNANITHLVETYDFKISGSLKKCSYFFLLFTVPDIVIDDQSKVSVVVDDQLVIITRARYSVTEKGSLCVTRTHPKTGSKRCQTSHAWDFDYVSDSFVWRMESTV